MEAHYSRREFVRRMAKASSLDFVHDISRRKANDSSPGRADH